MNFRTLSFIIIILILIIATYTIALNSKSFVEMNIGDDFSGLKLFDYNGNHANVNNIYGERKVFFYLSQGCKSCIEKLGSICDLKNIFDSENILIYIIWEGQIPINRVKQCNIPLEANFATKDYHINKITPAVFSTNIENVIDFHVEVDMQPVILYLINHIENTEDIQNKAFDHVINKYCNAIDKNNDNVFVFTTDYCDACKDAILDLDNVKSNKNVAFFNSSEYLYDKDYVNIEDKLYIYETIFEVGRFPAFLSRNNNIFKLSYDFSAFID